MKREVTFLIWRFQRIVLFVSKFITWKKWIPDRRVFDTTKFSNQWNYFKFFWSYFDFQSFILCLANSPFEWIWLELLYFFPGIHEQIHESMSWETKIISNYFHVNTFSPHRRQRQHENSSKYRLHVILHTGGTTQSGWSKNYKREINWAVIFLFYFLSVQKVMIFGRTALLKTTGQIRNFAVASTEMSEPKVHKRPVKFTKMDGKPVEIQAVYEVSFWFFAEVWPFSRISGLSFVWIFCGYCSCIPWFSRISQRFQVHSSEIRRYGSQIHWNQLPGIQADWW